MQNKGLYKCLTCNVHIKVKSTSRHRGYDYPKLIKKCPHCNSEIVEIQSSKYDDLEKCVWISVMRNNIRYSLKFPMKEVKKCTT